MHICIYRSKRYLCSVADFVFSLFLSLRPSLCLYINVCILRLSVSACSLFMIIRCKNHSALMHVRPRVQGLALRQTPQGVEEAFFSISSRGRFFERPHRDDL